MILPGNLGGFLRRPADFGQLDSERIVGVSGRIDTRDRLEQVMDPPHTRLADVWLGLTTLIEERGFMKSASFAGCRRTRRGWGMGAVIVAVAFAFLGGPALAEPINFFPTGNAEQDLSKSRFPNVVILIDNPLFPDNPTNDVAQAQFMTDEGWLSGWNLKDVRFLYDPSNDTMGVSVNFFKNPDGTGLNIAGDADGNGDPNSSDLRTIAAGGIDQPNFRGTESISVALDLDRNGVPDVVAGVPADKPGDGLAAFTVARYRQVSGGGIQPGIEQSYGQTLTNNVGALTYFGTREAPDFQFTIRNFSALPGFTPEVDPLTGDLIINYDVRTYAGSLDDVVSGEDLFFGQVRGQIVPEPSSIVAMTALAALFGWRAHRRLKVKVRSVT